MNADPILELENINKSFRGLKAIEAISLSLSPGEIVGLIGPNGAGKTTLFNVISGFSVPDSGSVTFKGQSLIGLKPHKICKLGLTRTFQIVKPFNHLTIWSIIATPTMTNNLCSRRPTYNSIFHNNRVKRPIS